jgi:hypothetical protein
MDEREEERKRGRVWHLDTRVQSAGKLPKPGNGETHARVTGGKILTVTTATFSLAGILPPDAGQCL